MKSGLALASGTGLGAGLMYLLDPDRGRRRRALVRDRVVHTGHTGRHVADVTMRKVAHRARRLTAAMSEDRFFRMYGGDEVVVARVRAALGRVVSHPHAIQVSASEGQVTLSGHILACEAGRLLKRVSRVRGVTGVVDQLVTITERK